MEYIKFFFNNWQYIIIVILSLASFYLKSNNDNLKNINNIENSAIAEKQKNIVELNQKLMLAIEANKNCTEKVRKVEESYSKLREDYQNEFKKLNEIANPKKGSLNGKATNKDINDMFSNF